MKKIKVTLAILSLLTLGSAALAGVAFGSSNVAGVQLLDHGVGV